MPTETTKDEGADREDGTGAQSAQADPGSQECVSGKFRKKPVVIEAVQLTRAVIEAHLFDKAPLPDGVKLWNATYHEGRRTISHARFGIDTLEGKMEASEGDWIIKGVKGEFYPCKPDIFAATYEQAADVAGPPANEVSHLTSAAASGMLGTLKYVESLSDERGLSLAVDGLGLELIRTAIAAAVAAGIKE